MKIWFDEATPNYNQLTNAKTKRLVDKLSPDCQQCDQKMAYKCIQPGCQRKKLICPECDVYQLSGDHFNHRFSYVLPFFKDHRKIYLSIVHEEMNKTINNLSELCCYFKNIFSQLSLILDTLIKQSQQINQCY